MEALVVIVVVLAFVGFLFLDRREERRERERRFQLEEAREIRKLELEARRLEAEIDLKRSAIQEQSEQRQSHERQSLAQIAAMKERDAAFAETTFPRMESTQERLVRLGLGD